MQRIRTPDGVIRYTYASPGMRDTFGLDPATIIAEPVATHDWIHPDDRGRFIESLRRSADELTTLDEEVRVIGADNKERWVRSIGHPKRLADGTIVWDGIALDVTDRRETADALARMLALTRQAEAAQSRAVSDATRAMAPTLVAINAELDALAASDLPAGTRTMLQRLRKLIDELPGAADIPRPAVPARAELSPRQNDVLRLIAQGLSNRAIGARLGITEGTAKLHVAAMLRQLGVKNRTEAAMFGLRTEL
jgi:PAS domain S-box-containing protein